MLNRNTAKIPVRTVLALRIRQRQQTYEEFSEYAEEFARKHGEKGTLSIRHLQRLAAGAGTGGTPLGPLRPATARLLERIFDTHIDELLAAPGPLGATKDFASLPSLSNESFAAERGPGADQGAAAALRVAIAVVVKDSEVLLVCRRGDDGAGISWQFPAGIMKPGISPETVAVQETLSETGVHCSVVRQLGSRVHPATNVLCHYLLCEYLAGDAHNLDMIENVSVMWVDRKILHRFVPPDRMFPPILEALEVARDSAGS